MVIRLGAMILFAALACGSAHGQSLLLRQGQAGPFVQAAYGTSNSSSGTAKGKGGEIHLGYAFSPAFDLGLGASYNKVTDDSWWSSESGEAGRVGQFIDFYPVRSRGRKSEFALGFHESYMAALDEGDDAIISGIFSVNVVTRSAGTSGVSVSAGVGAVREAVGGANAQLYGAGELCFFWTEKTVNPGGLFVGCNGSEGAFGFVFGLTFGFNK